MVTTFAAGMVVSWTALPTPVNDGRFPIGDGPALVTTFAATIPES